MNLTLWTDIIPRNVRYATRSLLRSQALTATIVLTLAVAIGANTAVFSAIDAILLRPLPFPDGDRLVRVSQRLDGTSETFIAPVRLTEWNRLTSTFEGITGFYIEDVSEVSSQLPERVRRASVAPNFIEVFGIQPAIGRGFTPDEHRFGGPAAVLVSERYWRGRFAADSRVLEKTIRVGALSYPIVGVMPASFMFPDRDVDIWTPVAMDAPFTQSRQATWFNGIGRLKRGITVDQARANLSAVQRQLGAEYPSTDQRIAVVIEPLKETTVGAVRSSLWLLFGAVSTLLLIACTNIAALLLSRAAARRQEIAVRVSLGGSRRSILALAFTESAVLAASGAAVGLLLAAAASRAFRVFAATIPRMQEVTFDWRVLYFTLVVAVVVTLVCGIVPALRSARDVGAGVAGAARTQVSSRNAVHWTLVGIQVALSVTLLAGAGLLLRSLYELSQVNPGFDASRVIAFRVSGSFSESGNYGGVLLRIEGTLDALRTVPGVEAAATSFGVPGVPQQFQQEFALGEGRAETAPRLVAESRSVSPSYFETMRIPLVAGEACRRQPLGRGELMVNRVFAERFLGGASPVGLRLRTAGAAAQPPAPIVGVVADARELSIDREPVPTVYSCMSAPTPTPVYLVRTRLEPSSVAGAIRLRLKEIEPLRSVYDIRPLDEQIGEAFTQNRLRAVLLTLFAVTALSLTAVGLYGTLSYIVNRRRREAGLRLALGASRREMVTHFMNTGICVVAAACAIGLALSLVFARVVSGMLYGVSPSDPTTLSGVVVIVLTVSAVALTVPAARIAFLAPMEALREE